eukprot:GHUV01010433.1.p2 GENE.GHUV01010433.1~~GHUV01010433.1.p2  ORF type:complete len:108 (+),score=6.01 GHUV01010433.1:300-623(+)
MPSCTARAAETDAGARVTKVISGFYAPWSMVKCLSRCFDCFRHVSFVTLRDLAYHLLCAWVHNGHLLAGYAVDPFAVDEQLRDRNGGRVSVSRAATGSCTACCCMLL